MRRVLAGMVLGLTTIGFATALAAVAGLANEASAQTLTTLHSFGLVGDGSQPGAGLIADPSSNLYGTTVCGGITNCVGGGGTVFKVTPSGSETVLYSFTGGSDGPNPGDGANPVAGLITDASGNLYGTTNAGGGSANCYGGCGTVFKVTPSGSETVLYSFTGGSDGAYPQAALIADTSGNLYGTTFEGGAYDGGSVFKLTPSGIETVLHSFNCCIFGDGGSPLAGLVADVSGNLYGATFSGGADVSYGMVFKVTPSGTETVIHSFAGGSDGANPRAGLITDAAGNLYGTTYSGGGSAICAANPDRGTAAGCGTVFKLTPSGSETVLYSFIGGSDGANPQAGLIADALGNLYGTTSGGGASGNGTVFKVTPSGHETVLHSFTGGSDGEFPQAGLIFDAAGNLYGTTSVGGAKVDGTAFELSGVGTPLSKNPQTADFNADQKSDLLWQNTNGAVAVWEMSGTKRVVSGGSGNPGVGWRAIGAGYFWGSPYADILLQNLNGAVQIWQMSGWKKVGGGVVGNPAPAWHAIATGDFNDDGKADILWQNTNGSVAIWEMNGLKPIASATIANPGAAWHVVGSGDFNGDGYSDILWQNANGAVAIWEMKGFKIVGSATIGNPGTAWHVIGSGDFNRDGYADILFQNTNGAVAIWEMNGLKRIGGGTVGTPAVTWHVVGTGDYNGDGYSDILLQNTNGTVEIWEMDGIKITKSGSPGNPGPAWHAIGE